MPQAYLTVSWDRLHEDARSLAERLATLGPFTGIVAITRGGLIPAAIVARELEIRLVDSFSIVTYEEQERGKPTIAKHPAAAGDGSGFLMIDDLVDTGTTAKVARAVLPRAHFACVYAKPLGRTVVDTYLTDVPQDTWIRFPWDTSLQFAPPLVRR